MKTFSFAYKEFIAFFSLTGIMLLSMVANTLFAQSHKVAEVSENVITIEAAYKYANWVNHLENSPVMLNIVDPSGRYTDFRNLDRPVTYKDGIDKFSQSITFPKCALAAGIEGHVAVSYIVEPDGSTSDIRVHHSLHPHCDQEVIKAIQQAKFNPGMIDGTPVRVRCFTPVKFVITP
jgi:TonB family protein